MNPSINSFLFRSLFSHETKRNSIGSQSLPLCSSDPRVSIVITTVVSADLGTHSSLRGDARALAIVTATIDSTGSVGAALGPLLTGFLSTKGWDAVFAMLMTSALIASILLSCLVVTELTERNSNRNLYTVAITLLKVM